MTAFDVTLADIEAARSRIAGRVRRTPAYESADVSARLGRRTALKMEALQLAGSFKVRGVFNKVLTLSDEERRRGLVTVSGGNHAIAVARVAGALDLDALVLMPKVTPRFNVDLATKYGARIELCDDAAEAFAKAEDYQRQGRLFVHPYDDPAIIAGHGTLGLEFLDDVPDLTHVFVSIGGGGFMSGVAAALKAKRPSVTIYGVETTGAPTMTEALKAGEPVTIRPTSIARTLGAPFATHRTVAGAKLFLKGTRCYTKKCSFERRPTPPGQHGVRRRKVGEYGLQLREKQKIRKTYGVLERQFRNYFTDADSRPGVTGENLLRSLELRLDNVAYRMGFAPSRPSARQLVGHGHVLVNGRPTNIPSYQLRPGDRVEIRESHRNREPFKVLKETLRSHQAPEWVSVDAANLGGRVVDLPRRDQMPLDLNEQLVVEYYSR